MDIMVDMDMVNEVASVWVFLDGVASSRLDIICIPFRTIDLQKGVLKYAYLKEWEPFENSKWKGFPTGRHDAIFSNRKIADSVVRMRVMSSRIANEGDSEQGASRQQISNIWNPSEKWLKWSHRGKIALYLDRIH